MELIKKIKHAETQAQQIIEQARAQAAAQVESGRVSRLQSLEQAEHDRRKAIEDAVDAAQSQGLAEVGGLKAQAEKKRKQLHKNAANKMTPAVAKVMDYLKG